MKNARKLLIAVLCLVLTVVLFAAMPTLAYAEDATMTQSIVTVSTENITIDPLENSVVEDKTDATIEKIEFPTHTMAVTANGASFSSFELHLRLPAFVTVTEVRVGEMLARSENQVFTPYVNAEEGAVNVAYSNPNAFANVVLFYVDFTVNDYTEQYGSVEQVKCSFANEDAKTVASSCSFGTIRIGKEQMGMKGDVNGDRKVTLADLLVIQRSMVNEKFPLDEAQFTAADIDNNGSVDILDCQYIQNYLIGKIDSLENIGTYIPPQQTYSISVNAFDTEGNHLFSGVFMGISGAEYNRFLNQVRSSVGSRYSIEAYVGLHSDVYGELDPNIGSDGLTVKSDDTVTMTFKIASGESEKAVQYTFSTAFTGEDGSVTSLSYTFYTDSTVLGVMELIVDGKTEKTIEQTLKWQQVDQYIDVYMEDGTAQRMFVVSADGVLSQYDGEQPEQPDYPSEDYLQQVSYNFAVGVVVGSDPSVLVEKFCKHTITMVFSQSGEVIVEITPDMIDYKNVNFNEIGEYEVTIRYSVNGRNGEIYTDVYVVEDKSDVEVLGVYDFAQISDMMGINTLTVYADGTVMLDDYYVTAYETLKEGVIVFSMDGGDFVVSLDDTAKTATFYQPSEKMIGKYVYSMGDMFSMTFEVYGEYTGAGYYVAVYSVDAGEYKVAMTTRVYLDLENCELGHVAMPCDMTFDASGVLVEDHDEQKRVVAPTCDQSGWEIVECSKCGREVSRTEIPALGHEFGEDGVCANCGCSQGETGDIENARMKALEQMEKEWANLQAQYGDLSAYIKQYDKYLNEIKSASELYTIEEYMGYFQNMVQEIHNKLGGETTDCAHENTYSNIVTSATCYQEGWVEWYCQDCGVQTSAYSMPVMDHMYDEKKGACIWCGTPMEGDGTCYHYDIYMVWVKDATCTEQGEHQNVCRNCGTVVGTYYSEPYGHDMSPYKGYCYRCGYECESFDELREMIVDKLCINWENLTAQYSMSEDEMAHYNDIYNAMNTATTNEELAAQWEQFEQLRSEIYNSRNDNYQGSSLSPEFDDSQEIIEVTVGASKEDFLKQFVGKTLYLKFSITGVVEITITEDMIDADSLDFSEVGEAYFSIRFEYNNEETGANISGSYGVNICVAPDLSKATQLGTYQIGGLDLSWELYEITLFDNGWMKLVLENGEYACYVAYEKDGNVVAFDLLGEGIMILELNEENKSFYYYRPDESVPVIGKYEYDGGAIELYGEYTGVGEYICVVVWPEEYTGGESVWMTFMVTVDLEQGYIDSDAFGGRMQIHEDGTITEWDCGDNHTWEITEQREPTCTTEGRFSQHCIYCGCGQSSYTEPLGHNYDETGVCTRCGASGTGAGVEETEKDYSDSFVSKEELENSYVSGGTATDTAVVVRP